MMEKVVSEFSKKLCTIFKDRVPNSLIGNLDAHIFCEEDGNVIISEVSDVVDNVYVVSLYSMMITYSKDELVKIDSRSQRLFASTLIRIFEKLLLKMEIDKSLIINNYLLSTNFFSKAVQNSSLAPLSQSLISQYPEHLQIIRCVNQAHNPQLFETLKKEDWRPLVSRQVYLFDSLERSMKHQNFKRDRKLLESSDFIFVKPDLEDITAFENAEALYNQLYLQKYSVHNVQFKALYLQELVRHKLIHLRLLLDVKKGLYVGVVGMMGEDGIITAPLVGYDTSTSPQDAHYRRIIAYILEYGLTRGYRVNLSSGAPEFKKLRGATAALEYMFIKSDHLSFGRRVLFKTLEQIANHFYGPLLKRLKL